MVVPLSPLTAELAENRDPIAHFSPPLSTNLIAASIEIMTIFLLLTITTILFNVFGAIAAAIAIVTGRLLANGYPLFPCAKVLKRLKINVSLTSKFAYVIQSVHNHLGKSKDLMKIFAFAGISDSGKTWLIQRLIAELKDRGYSVSVAKHCPHGFDLEAQWKDTARFMEAGSDAVCMYSSDGRIVLQTKKAKPDVKSIAQDFFNYSDYVFIEGNRGDKSLRKIEVLRKGISEKMLCSPQELIAVVSDFEIEGIKPVFHPEKIKTIADFLETFPDEQSPSLILDIDGASVPMNSFVQKIISSTLLGMVESLDGVKKNPQCITLSLTRKGKHGEKI